MKKVVFIFLASIAMYSCQSDLDTVVEKPLKSTNPADNEVYMEWYLSKDCNQKIYLGWYVTSTLGSRISLESIQNISIMATTNKGIICFDAWYPGMPWPKPTNEVEDFGNGNFNINIDGFEIKANNSLNYYRTCIIPQQVLEGVEWIQLGGADLYLGNDFCAISAGDESGYIHQSNKHTYYCYLYTSRIRLK